MLQAMLKQVSWTNTNQNNTAMLKQVSWTNTNQKCHKTYLKDAGYDWIRIAFNEIHHNILFYNMYRQLIRKLCEFFQIELRHSQKKNLNIIDACDNHQTLVIFDLENDHESYTL